MQNKKSRASGFTLVEIICVVVIVTILVAMAIPNFTYKHGRTPSQQNACINNLRQIDGAKDQWAIEKQKKRNDPVIETEVNEYIKAGAPSCPLNGTYIYGGIGTNPTCSLSSLKSGPHRLQ